MNWFAFTNGLIIFTLLCITWELVQLNRGLKRRSDYYYDQFQYQYDKRREERREDHNLLMGALQENVKLRRRIDELEQANEVRADG